MSELKADYSAATIPSKRNITYSIVECHWKLECLSALINDHFDSNINLRGIRIWHSFLLI
jgi:hypothetical protein